MMNAFALASVQDSILKNIKVTSFAEKIQLFQGQESGIYGPI